MNPISLPLKDYVFFVVFFFLCWKSVLLERRRKAEKFKCVHDPHGSKNRNGGFYQQHIDSKEDPIYKNPSSGQWCLVTLLDIYFNKLPEKN